VGFYRGSRIYNYHDTEKHRWVWNYKHRPIPGEIFLLAEERKFAESFGTGFILVEPNVPSWKPSAVNKQWPRQNWVELVERLRKYGHQVIEIGDGLKAPDFRHALAVMERAALYIGPEGGLHHGAAAVGTKAVVLFGSWIPPQVTGYDMHVNISTGLACGSLKPCQHCVEGMQRISVDSVFHSAMSQL
jgi:ADP-heptose:LPS heptosyltransferase